MNAKLSQSNRLGRLILFFVQNFAPGFALLLVATVLYNWSTNSDPLYIPIKEVAVKTVSSGFLQGTEDDDGTEDEDILFLERKFDLESVEHSMVETQLNYYINIIGAQERHRLNYSDTLR